MQNNRLTHARRIFLSLSAALMLALAGCQTPPITNLTPGSLPANPSQIYTISARINPHDAGLIKNSVVPRIIIDGQSHTMTKSSLGNDIYDFDYQVAAGRSELRYYFLVTYQVLANDIIVSREAYTDVQSVQIVGRYVLSLEVNRGPVGARVSVLGRGFTPEDVIYFESTPVRTVYESPNAVSFYVPALDANQNYRVSIGSVAGQSLVGTFRIDAIGGAQPEVSAKTVGFGSAPTASAGPLTASPSELKLRQGEKTSLTFTAPITASAGGLLIDVTTDVPDSIIMPEVVIPQGSTTVTITVEGGLPGTGSLYVKGAGAQELRIPVTVK